MNNSLKHVPLALEVVDSVFAKGERNHGWQSWRQVNNAAHLFDHFAAWWTRQGDENRDNSIEDHLANMVCRGLILLQLRKEATSCCQCRECELQRSAGSKSL